MTEKDCAATEVSSTTTASNAKVRAKKRVERQLSVILTSYRQVGPDQIYARGRLHRNGWRRQRPVQCDLGQLPCQSRSLNTRGCLVAASFSRVCLCAPAV